MEWYDRIIIYGLLIYISVHSGLMISAITRMVSLWKKILDNNESK